MQKRMCCFLFFLMVKNVSFSQTIKETINSQIDKIVLSASGNVEYTICAYVWAEFSGQVYIIKRAQDSLHITTYTTNKYNKIGGAYSVSVLNDTLFVKTVDSIYWDTKQYLRYQSYSKNILTSGDDFFLTFYKGNNLQVFYNKEDHRNKMTGVDFLFRRLDAYTYLPFGGINKRLKLLGIKNFNEMLSYLKSLDSVPK